MLAGHIPSSYVNVHLFMGPLFFLIGLIFPSLHPFALICSFNGWLVAPWWLPGGSDAKVSACRVGDLGLIPGLGRFAGEGNGNPLQ